MATEIAMRRGLFLCFLSTPALESTRQVTDPPDSSERAPGVSAPTVGGFCADIQDGPRRPTTGGDHEPPRGPRRRGPPRGRFINLLGGSTVPECVHKEAKLLII
eukprot:9492263-Pyramimonas_sp.AAC.2